MIIHAIDPGTTKSALVMLYDDGGVSAKIDANAEILASVWCKAALTEVEQSVLVIEQIASYGMSVGAEIFETVFWSGRFAEAWERRSGSVAHRMTRV